jgi:hypothetical protein
MTAPETTDPSTTGARPGSGADLSRRMDRMEQRQDSTDTKVTELASVVARVEMNQQHATELAKLRFDAVDTAVKNIDATLERFMGRINAIVSGEVKLPQTVQGEQMVSDYLLWRKAVDANLAELRNQNTRQSGVNAGIGQTFGTGKAIVVTAAAVVTAVIAVIGFIGGLQT